MVQFDIHARNRSGRVRFRLWSDCLRAYLSGEMSEEERLALDNNYAKTHSLWNDIRIILRTIPALFQSENV